MNSAAEQVQPAQPAGAAAPRSPRVAAILLVATVLLWLLLTGSLETQELIAGVLVAAAATVLSVSRSAIVGGLLLTPAAPFHMLAYLGVFFVALIKSNLDVARRVLAPSLPINPGVVQLRTELASELGRLLLANSITLTPGTLTVSVDADRLLVHWIDCPPNVDMEEATRLIAADFEKHLKGFVA
jgi:multicomponent Na+:H+ antiporter subunit E